MKTDAEIQRDVLEELRWDPGINASDLQATVVDGTVTLRGEIRSYAERVMAEADAWRIAGVRAVNNIITIMPDLQKLHNDEDLAAMARRALRAHVSVPDGQIQVSVVDGWLTLGGEVRWHFQRKAAEDAIRSLPNVRGITNSIKLVPLHPTEADVKDRIERAFQRNAEIDAERIIVEIGPGTVTLQGSVRSRAERNAAIDAAWSAPGVVEVRDRLEVVSR
jgi:osmotically-inducible protein OsmY